MTPMWTVLGLAVALLTQGEDPPAPEAPPPAATSPQDVEELAPPPTAEPAPPGAEPVADVLPTWRPWIVDVAVGTGAGFVTGVVVPLVLGAIGEAVVLGLAYSMLQASTDGWGDLAAVAMVLVGNAALIPALVLCAPVAETAGFVAGATVSAVVRKLVPALRVGLDWPGDHTQPGLRAGLAPILVVLAAAPGLAVAGLVTLAGVAVVSVMFFLFNSVGIGTLGSNVVLGMMLGALGFMWLGLVLHGALALTLRPLLLFGFSLADRALAQRGDGVESPP